MSNQQNDNLNNLVNSNVNNHKQPIYWNEQNEEAFLQEIELQNLFANTLLHDDFTDETDFNCLGIDNLQLNYNTNESSNEQQPTSDVNSINDNNVISSLSLISLNNHSASNSEHQNFIFDSGTAFNTFNSIDLSGTTNLIAPEQILINDFKAELSPIDILNVENQSFIKQEVTPSQPIQIQTSQNEDDDNLFKKPNLFDTFFTNPTAVKNASNTSSSRTRSSNMPTDSKAAKTKIKHNKIISLLEPIDLISQLKKMNNQQESKSKQKEDISNESSEMPTILTTSKSATNTINIDSGPFATSSSSINKLFTLKRSRKRSKLLSNSNKIGQTVTNNNNQDIATSVTSQNKINNKLAKLNSSSVNKASKKEKKEKLKLAKLNSNFEPSNKKFAISIESSTPLTTNNASAAENIIASIKKTAKTEQNIPNILLISKSNNLQVKPKKEDVELHIKELSLLDLHSSEDDTAELLIKNALNGKLKKNLRSSSNDNNLNTNSVTVSSSNKNPNYLNEIISKRIKYSPVLSNSVNATNSSDNNSTETDSQNQELLNENIKERRIDKLIQYLTKSSLDSTANSISSNTSSNESLQLKKLNNQESNSSGSILIINSSSLDLNLFANDNSTTPPTPSFVTNSVNNSNSQNKRKKNENTNSSSSYINSSNINTDSISSSLPTANTLNENQIIENKPIKNSDSSKSLSIDSDTLQHMKNLDLNLDLRINTNSNESSPFLNNNGNNITSKLKAKNFKKNKKTSHSVYLEQSNEANSESTSSSSNLTIDLNDTNSRKNLWNLLKSNSSVEEMVEEFGSELHDKISFWDLVKLKLKFSKNSQLKTTYEIIDDYTILYSNMSSLLESFVEEHSSNKSTLTFKKNENSSRSRSSSRNCRKQSSTAPLHRI